MRQISKVVLMHGKDTDPSRKWYPWLVRELSALGIEVSAPMLPKAGDPEVKEWLAVLDGLEPDENTVLVGHSRGGVAILRWLEKSNSKVGKVILAATNSGGSEKPSHGFFTKTGYDFEKIRLHSNHFVVFHSKDDPWVSFGAGEENAKGLKAKFVVFKDKKHFGENLKEFPELLIEILE